MLNIRFLQRINNRLVNGQFVRKFNQGLVNHDSKGPAIKDNVSANASQQTSSNINDTLGSVVEPSDFQKRILVWVKKYPSVDKIPARISIESMSQAQTKARIKTCNYMILVTVIGFITAAILGKREARSQDIIDQQLLIIEGIKNKENKK